MVWMEAFHSARYRHGNSYNPIFPEQHGADEKRRHDPVVHIFVSRGFLHPSFEIVWFFPLRQFLLQVPYDIPGRCWDRASRRRFGFWRSGGMYHTPILVPHAFYDWKRWVVQPWSQDRRWWRGIAEESQWPTQWGKISILRSLKSLCYPPFIFIAYFIWNATKFF